MEQKLIKLIKKTLNLKSQKINLNSKIGDFQEWDSLGHLNIYFELQKSFKIDIDLEIASKARSVNDWLKIIKNITKK
jgi:acyl carrier protein